MREYFSGSPAELVTLMKAQAAKGELLQGAVDQNVKYQRSCEVHHVPTKTTLAFTRDVIPLVRIKAWHLSMSFTTGYGYMAFDEAQAVEWLKLFYGKHVSHVKAMGGMSDKRIKHYLLYSPAGMNYLDLDS
jgi:hypothetical protein